MKRQGDFSEATIEVLAKRVAYLCSRAALPPANHRTTHQ